MAARLALGGGGLGQVWGTTSRSEAVATVHLAVNSGVTCLDLAPLYGNGEAESVIGEAFGGKLPQGVQITTKVWLGSPPLDTVERTVRASLEASLSRMRLRTVDLFLLHSNILPDGDEDHKLGTTWTGFVPVVEALKREGKIKRWGITGVGKVPQILRALQTEPRPQAVQVVTNAMDSLGGLQRFEGPPNPRAVIALASYLGVPVLGIRAVQAGALTDAMDRELKVTHPDRIDFQRAAPFRAYARSLGQPAAVLAHSYALSIPGVASVILGVKNRRELRECLTAGPLSEACMRDIDKLLAGQRNLPRTKESLPQYRKRARL